MGGAARGEGLIRVGRQPEPDDFDVRVRKRGKAFLARVPHPTPKEWANHDYWVDILGELHSRYTRICAYSCLRIPYVDGRSVDHFHPKAKYPGSAYEWDNYRLVFSTLNGRKGTYEDVLDPFEVEDGWFMIEFPSLLVRPSPTLTPGLRSKVINTCKHLGLNEEDTCLRERYDYVRLYCRNLASSDEGIPWATLVSWAPFLARELDRQGLRGTINQIMNL